MKKFIQKLNIKLIMPIVLLNLIQGQLYYLAKLSPVPITIVNSALDNSIPMLPIFIYPYVLWHVLLFLVPYLIFQYSKKAFFHYLTANTITIVISFFIFILFPTYFIRPEIEVTNLTSFIIEMVYLGDTPAVNCFPSFHCTTSFLFIYIFLLEKSIPKKWRVSGIMIFFLIILSTAFVKQHALIDILGAFFITNLVYAIVERTGLWKKTRNLYNRFDKKLHLEG